MSIILNGTTGITTPGITNTGPFVFQGTIELPAGTVTAPSLTTTGDTNTGIYFPAANQVAITTDGTQRVLVDASGNLLVGTTTANTYSGYATFQLGQSTSGSIINFQGGATSTTSAAHIRLDCSGTTVSSLTIETRNQAGTSSTPIVFKTQETERARITSDGNFGLGVTPGSWGSGVKAIQLGSYSTLSNDSAFTVLTNNSLYNGTNNIYLNTAAATQYYQNAGQHVWRTAASGTAGNTITFTQAMTLDSSGRLGIGETAPASTLVVRKDASAAVGAEISLVNFAVGGTVGNAAQINFGLENSTYAGDSSNAQIKAITTTVNNSSDFVYSLWNGSVFAERFRMAATGVFTSTGVSMANGSSNATAISVNTSTPTTIASVTITTKGKPVFVLGLGDMNPDVAGNWQYFRIFRDGSAIGKVYIGQTANGSYNLPFSVCVIDTPSAGSHTYDLRAYQGVGVITYGETGNDQAPTIIAIEVM